MKFGPQNGRQSDAMAQERRRWSIVSKSARGLYLLDADLKRGKSPTCMSNTQCHVRIAHKNTFYPLSLSITVSEFRREGVQPSAWIWPDRMSVYLHMNHDSETVYSERGPGAHEALASGNVPASFRGLPVYTVSLFFFIMAITTTFCMKTHPHSSTCNVCSHTHSTQTSTVHPFRCSSAIACAESGST